MRKFLAGVMMAALAGSTVQADILGIKNLTVDGSVEFLGNKATNETDANDPANDTRGDVQSRLRLGVNGQVTEGVSGRVEFYRNGATANNDAQFDSSEPDSLSDEQNSIHIGNAFVDLVDFMNVDQLRLGRQYVGAPGDAIAYFGPIKDDALSVSFLDALALWHKFGPINLTAVTGKLDEDDTARHTGDTNAGDAGDETNVLWVTVGSDELIKSDELSVPLQFGYYLANSAAADMTSDNTNLVIYDLRAGLNLMENQVKLSLEYAKNAGQANTGPGTQDDFEGDALFFNAAFAPTDAGWEVRALYANASGDDNPADTSDKQFMAINSDYRFGHILSRNNTVLGGSAATIDSFTQGLNVLGFGGTFTPPILDGKYTVLGDYFMVKSNEPGAGNDDAIGNELDIAVKYTHNDYVSAKFGYSLLMTDDGFATTYGGTGDDDVSELWAKLMFKWGGATVASH